MRLALALVAGGALLATVSAQTSLPDPVPQRGFVANEGQWRPVVKHRLRKGPLTAWFTQDGWTFTLVRTLPGPIPAEALARMPNPRAAAARGAAEGVAVRMTFRGASQDAVLAGEQRRSSYHNFLVGDANHWRTRVPEHSRLRYRGVWPGADVVVRPSQNLFEYDLELGSPEAAGQVAIRCEGIDRLELLADGTLRLHTALGAIDQSAPPSWQDARGTRTPLACRYRLLGPDAFGFEVHGAAPGRAVVIDPDIRWSTFHGGSTTDHANSIERDAQGRHVVCGDTNATDFPTTMGAFQPAPQGLLDAFVSKFDETLPPAQQLVWSTYVGGNADDLAFDLALDSAGMVTIAGYTYSTNFPRSANTPNHAGALDAFVLRLTGDGVQMFFSRLLGGPGDDWASSVAVDQSLVATVAGTTFSASGFPLTGNAYQSTFGGTSDAFVTQVTPANQVSYSTYLGGSSWEGVLWTNWWNYPMNIRLVTVSTTPAGQLALGGTTWSPNFPLVNAAQSTKGTFGDKFLCILDPRRTSATQLVWSTFFGGIDNDFVNEVHVDRAGIVTAAGASYATDLRTTNGAFQTRIAGRDDATIVRFDPALSGQAQLLYSSFLGGVDWDSTNSMHVDARGHATIGGFCGAGFPTTAGAWQAQFGGNQDAWYARFRLEGNGTADLYYCSLLGGPGYDLLHGLSFDGPGGAHLCGATQSASFPAVNARQPILAGGYDGFVTRADLLPSNVARLDGARPHCDGAVLFEVDRLLTPPLQFQLLCGNAPPNAGGALAIGSQLTNCTGLFGASLCVNPLLVLPWTSNAAGTASLTAIAPWGLNGTLGVQVVWINTRTCAGSQPLTSSAALGM
jgi:hypothetical protein